MNDDEACKKFLMSAGYAHAAAVVARERRQLAAAPQIGDATRRAECCGPVRNVFPLGTPVEDIPELRDRLEHIGKINTGYTKVFACRVCGQRWEEDAVQRGQGESPQVAKQGFSWYDTRLKPP